MERVRTRERDRVERSDRLRPISDVSMPLVADDTIEDIPAATAYDESSSQSPSDNTTNAIDDVPAWLHGMRPIVWHAKSTCGKRPTVAQERNCCLFSPLEACAVGSHIMNGFCLYHLRAIFNVVYLYDVSYRLVDGRASIVTTSRSFVAEPFPVDDNVTAVFPVFEMFEQRPRPEDIKLHNFARYLQASGKVGWEKTYARHVNFLYNLITLRQQLPSSQADHDLNSLLNVHWNMWNEYNSWMLSKYPATLHLYYATADGNVQTAAIANFTAITQMVCRLFTLPYSDNEQLRFVPTLANYGFHLRRHLSCLNNLCSSGSMSTKDGLEARGNIATLQCIRTDKQPHSLQHFATANHCNEHRVYTRIDLNTPALNTLTAVLNDGCSSSSASAGTACGITARGNSRVDSDANLTDPTTRGESEDVDRSRGAIPRKRRRDN